MPQLTADPTRLDGKVAVVTGSSSGIGLAIARRLAEQGATVVVNSRTLDRAAAAAESLAKYELRVHPIAADVTSPEGPHLLIETTVAAHGTIDILVNNAGAPSIAPAEELSLEQWQRTLELNLTAPFLCAQAAGRVMLAKGSGAIVNVSSMLSRVALPGRLAYTVSKSGLDGLTTVLATEWGGRGVRTVSVNPGYVATPLVEGTMAAGKFSVDDVARRTPLGRIAEPEEIANVVAFLASPGASYINGAHVFIDGGWTSYGGW